MPPGVTGVDLQPELQPGHPETSPARSTARSGTFSLVSNNTAPAWRASRTRRPAPERHDHAGPDRGQRAEQRGQHLQDQGAAGPEQHRAVGRARSTTAVNADALEVDAYFGDVTADGLDHPSDSAAVVRITTSADSGFAAYQTLDPVIIGDTSGSGAIDPVDARSHQLARRRFDDGAANPVDTDEPDDHADGRRSEP